MIKAYKITPKGGGLMRDKGFPELKGRDRGELRTGLKMWATEYAVRGTFLFNTHPESSDHMFTQHMKSWEKMGCITRKLDVEEQIKEMAKSLPPESELSLEEFLENLA